MQYIKDEETFELSSFNKLPAFISETRQTLTEEEEYCQSEYTY